MPVDENLDDCEETVHCTWCRRCNRRQRALYTYVHAKHEVQGDINKATVGEKPRRRYVKETARRVDARDDDYVSGQCLMDDEGNQVRRRVRCLEKQPMGSPDKRFHCCHPEATGANKNCEWHPVEVPSNLEPSDAADTHTRHRRSSRSPKCIVIETTCPCLCGYLKFKDSIGACACQQHVHAHSLPLQKNEHVSEETKCWLSTSDVSFGSRSSLDCRAQKCCISRRFSCFPCLRKLSKSRSREHGTNKHPNVVVETTCQSKGSQTNDMKQHTASGPQKETRGTINVVEEINNKNARECCLCVFESSQNRFRKFNYGLKRICGALFGCQEGKCLCECHKMNEELKKSEPVKEVVQEREDTRREIMNSVAEAGQPSCGSGIATVKFDLLHFQQIHASEDARKADPTGELEHPIKYRSENTRETECVCSQTEGPKVDAKTRKRNKMLREASTENQKRNLQSVNRRVQFCSHGGFDCSCRTGDNTNYLVEHFHGEEACNIHAAFQGKVKQNICISRKPKLQNFHDENLSEISDNAEEQTNESDLDAVKKENCCISERHLRETDQKHQLTVQGEGQLEFLDGKTVKIEDKYYTLVSCGRTVPTLVPMSNVREQYRGAKDKRTQRVEERFKKQVTSNEEDQAYVTLQENGPFGDAPTLHSDNPRHLRNHRNLKQVSECEKSVDTSYNTGLKLLNQNPSCGKSKPLATQENNSDLPSSPPTPGTVLFLEGGDFVQNLSSRESLLMEDSMPVPKARTEPTSERAESRNESKSECDRKRTVSKPSAKTLELVEMSQRWLDGPVEEQSQDNATPGERVWDIPVNNWLEEVRPFSCSEESEE